MQARPIRGRAPLVQLGSARDLRAARAVRRMSPRAWARPLHQPNGYESWHARCLARQLDAAFGPARDPYTRTHAHFRDGAPSLGSCRIGLSSHTVYTTHAAIAVRSGPATTPTWEPPISARRTAAIVSASLLVPPATLTYLYSSPFVPYVRASRPLYPLLPACHGHTP